MSLAWQAQLPRADSAEVVDSIWWSQATHLAGSRDPLDRAAADSELLGNLVKARTARRSGNRKAMFQMMGVFAEFERAMIRERVNAGIARAKADGKHCGRPFIDTKLEGRIRDALTAPGRPGIHKIAKQFGVGSGTVQRIAAAS